MIFKEVDSLLGRDGTCLPAAPGELLELPAFSGVEKELKLHSVQAVGGREEQGSLQLSHF